MIVTGTLRRNGGQWTLREAASGKTYALAAVDFPPRMEGLSARVVGQLADSFGAGLGEELPVIDVQRWDAV
jgi:hypothetical protein